MSSRLSFTPPVVWKLQKDLRDHSLKIQTAAKLLNNLLDYCTLYLNELHTGSYEITSRAVADVPCLMQRHHNRKSSIPPRFLCIYSAWLVTGRHSYLPHWEQEQVCGSRDQGKPRRLLSFARAIFKTHVPSCLLPPSRLGRILFKEQQLKYS